VVVATQRADRTSITTLSHPEQHHRIPPLVTRFKSCLKYTHHQNEVLHRCGCHYQLRLGPAARHYVRLCERLLSRRVWLWCGSHKYDLRLRERFISGRVGLWRRPHDHYLRLCKRFLSRRVWLRCRANDHIQLDHFRLCQGQLSRRVWLWCCTHNHVQLDHL
jgi:hypothetical protein